MPKYRAWIAKVEIMQEFHTDAEARAWAMVERDKYKLANPRAEAYFDIDDCGSEDEDE